MKKIWVICIVAIFLISSVGIIYAAEDSNLINVKVIGDAPDQIKVSLISDGNVVDTAVLSSANSWKTTFKVDDGNYQLKTEDLSDYSVTVTGDAKKGFVITSKLIEQEVLGAANDGLLADDDSGNNGDSDGNNGDSTGDGTNSAGDGTNSAGDDTGDDAGTADTNSTDDNSTSEENSTDENADENNESSTDSTDGSLKSVSKEKTPVKEKQKIVEKSKKVVNTTKNKTGLPVAVLVVAAMAAIFVPFARKKE